jgi:hypothetical protein
MSAVDNSITPWRQLTNSKPTLAGYAWQVKL